MLEAQPHIELSNPIIQNISVEVLNIIGASASAISKDTNIFYDAEVSAVVHRYKSKLDGLVSTNLWIWRGRQSQSNDKEERKIQELSRRYGASPVGCIKNYTLVSLMFPVETGKPIFRTSTASVSSRWPTSHPSSEVNCVMDWYKHAEQCKGFPKSLDLREYDDAPDQAK